MAIEDLLTDPYYGSGYNQSLFNANGLPPDEQPNDDELRTQRMAMQGNGLQQNGAGAWVPTPQSRPNTAPSQPQALPPVQSQLNPIGPRPGQVPPVQPQYPQGQRPGFIGNLADLLGTTPERASRLSRAIGAGLANMGGPGGLAAFSRGMGAAMQGGQNYDDQQAKIAREQQKQQQDFGLRERNLESADTYRKGMLERGNYELVPGTQLDENGNTVSGTYRFDRRTGKQEFIPGQTVTSRSGRGSSATALQKNAQFYVDNSIAPDIGSAVKMLREGVNNANVFNRLVQAEKKLLLSDPRNAKMPPDQLEQQARQNVRQRTQSATGEDNANDALSNDPLGIR